MRLQKHSEARYFAYIPTKLYSGKWIWWRYYIRATAGEEVFDETSLALGWRAEYRRFTEPEWTWELLKL